MESYSIKLGYRSDHSIVTTELKIITFKRGRGFWKFNNSLLSDMNYVQKVNETIQDICKQYLVRDTEDIDDSSFLDVLLMEIRGITISYSTFKKKERENKEKSLLEEIDKLESEENINLHAVEEKRLLLENIRKEKMIGLMIRGKARLVEEGEKPTRYFCNLENRNY